MDDPIERKLAAVLYADVAGYSRLTGLDEEGTHRALSGHLDIYSAAVERHGGRVVHYAGDAVLADFSSVVAALSCAIDAQQRIAAGNADIPRERQVLFRTGINLGDVMVDRNDIYGDGVNVAARLEGLSDPGGICVSGAVYDQVQGRLDLGFTYLGRQQVKNIANPVRAYTVAFEGMPDPVAKRTPLVRLWHRFAGSRDGHRRIGAGIRHTFVAALTVGVLLAAVLLWPASTPLPPATPTVGVTPFRVIGSGALAGSFAEGLTEDLVTALSRRPGIQVLEGDSAVSGNTAYRVEGSIREVGERVRITARLVSIADGHSVWGARYDRDLADVLEVQGDVASRVALGLVGGVLTVEEERRESLAERGRAGSVLMTLLAGLGAITESAVNAGQAVFEGIMGMFE